MLLAKSASRVRKAKRGLPRAEVTEMTFERSANEYWIGYVGWFNEADPDEIKLLVSAIACFVGSITALLLHYFYR